MTEKSYVYDGKKYSKTEMQKIFGKSKNAEEDISQRFVQALNMIEGRDVLDVGCAAGSYTKQIAEKGFRTLGIDVLESSIEIAKDFNSTTNASYEVRDLLKKPFPENSFDCITFLETIEHVENPAGYLKEFYRILRPNGCLVLSTPNATSLKNILYALSYRKKKKRLKLAKEIATEQKHTGTQLEHIFNWDFPVLVRLLDLCGFEHVDHSFARSGPIIVPFFGKRREIIKKDSTFLKFAMPLMATHIIKSRKRSS